LIQGSQHRSGIAAATTEACADRNPLFNLNDQPTAGRRQSLPSKAASKKRSAERAARLAAIFGNIGWSQETDIPGPPKAQVQ
jgi:hypothetical protein